MKFCVNLVGIWPVFNVRYSSGLPLVSLVFYAPLLSSDSPKSLLKHSLCFAASSLSCNPITIYWSPMDVVVRCGGREVFSNHTVKS